VSFTDFDIYALADLRNLRSSACATIVRLLETPLFWQALGNTLYFVIVGVPLSIGASLGVALLLQFALGACKELLSHRPLHPRGHDARRGRRRLALSVEHALRTHQLRARPHRHRASRLAGRSALGDARDHPVRRVEELRLQHADPARRAAEHPQELYEAARIDGASRVQQFRYITLPSLAPILLMVSILTIAGHFQLFAEPYVMTQGGPLQSTVSVLYFMYEEGFKWWNLGSASAVPSCCSCSSSRDGGAASVGTPPCARWMIP
jgi:multiple sugar transport system permease protein